MLPRLQYITDSPHLAQQACKAGVKWIQIRIKNQDEKTWFEMAHDISKICRIYNVVHVVNDNLEIALRVNADGVHLGKKDMPVAEARRIIGNRKMLIGSSANIAEDVIQFAGQKVDYMGLGPLRFTFTKEDLNPILNMEGFKKTMKEVSRSGLSIPPVYAIGGVRAGDITGLLSVGVYGVAVSSAISGAENINYAVQEFFSLLGKKELNYENER